MKTTLCSACNIQLTRYASQGRCSKCYASARRSGEISPIVKSKSPEILTTIQDQFLTGLMLGDGCLFKFKPHFAPILSITHCTSDIEYLNWTYSFWKDFCNKGVSSREIVDKRTNKIYYQSKLSTRLSSSFEEYHKKWYINGVKVVPEIQLSPLTCLIWFCDDGCITLFNKQRMHIKFATHGFSKFEVEFLKTKLSAFVGEKFYLNPQGTNQFTIEGSDNAARAFCKVIDGIFPEAMLRKAKWRDPRVRFYEEIKRTKTFSLINGKRVYD